MDIKYPHKFSSLHREDILKSSTCGCFYCTKQFNSKKIVDWVDEDKNNIGQTALCPFCGIDSVIGDKSIKITEDLLLEMKKYWFYPLFY